MQVTCVYVPMPRTVKVSDFVTDTVAMEKSTSKSKQEDCPRLQETGQIMGKKLLGGDDGS